MAARSGRSQRRFRILPSILLTVVILMLPVGVYIWGRYADAFRVQRVVLTGVRRVPPKKALALLTRHYEGHNLFTVSGADVSRLLAVYPYFRSAHVDRDFPDTLRVAVTEYRPAACLLADGSWYVVAADGYVITSLGKARVASTSHAVGASATTSAGSGSAGASNSGASTTTSTATSTTTSTTPASTGAGTGSAAQSGTGSAAQTNAAAEQAAAALAATLVAGPSVRLKPAMPAVFTLSPVKVGATIADQQLLASLAVIGTLPAALSREAAYVRVNVAGNVRVYLRSGLQVDFGDDGRLAAKMLALKAVLAWYTHRHVTPKYVDVSVPDRPLATPMLPA
jgi:cell division septal protein FtsQ